MRKCEDPPTGALFAQIAENWNEQVTKLFYWSINRLQAAAEKSDGGATQTDYQLSLAKEVRRAGKLHRGKKASGFPSCPIETDLRRPGMESSL